MHTLKLLLILLIPSLLVGMVCVADRGLGALILSPIIILLPITQWLVQLSEFAIPFSVAMIISAVSWAALCLFLIKGRAIKTQAQKTWVSAVLGSLHAFSVPWAVDSLMWYA